MYLTSCVASPFTQSALCISAKATPHEETAPHALMVPWSVTSKIANHIRRYFFIWWRSLRPEILEASSAERTHIDVLAALKRAVLMTRYGLKRNDDTSVIFAEWVTGILRLLFTPSHFTSVFLPWIRLSNRERDQSLRSANSHCNCSSFLTYRHLLRGWNLQRTFPRQGGTWTRPQLSQCP